MKVDLEILWHAFTRALEKKKKKLLLKLEYLMSTITAPIADVSSKIDTLSTKLDALVTSNTTLTANAVTLQTTIDDLNAQLTSVKADLATAQAGATDPADATAIAAIEQKLADIIAKLP